MPDSLRARAVEVAEVVMLLDVESFPLVRRRKSTVDSAGCAELCLAIDLDGRSAGSISRNSGVFDE